MAPKKFRASKITFLQQPDRMMYEEEIKVLRTVLEDKEEHIEALEFSANNDSSSRRDEETIKRLERVIGVNEQNLKSLLIKIDHEKNEVRALENKSKKDESKYVKELNALKTIVGNLREEIDDLKRHVGEIEEENKKLKSLNSKIKEDELKCDKELTTSKNYSWFIITRT